MYLNVAELLTNLKEAVDITIKGFAAKCAYFVSAVSCSRNGNDSGLPLFQTGWQSKYASLIMCVFF